MNAARATWQFGSDSLLAPAFDRVARAVLLVNHAGQVAFANSAALAVLGAHDGVRLATTGSQVTLQVSDPAQRQALEALVASVRRAGATRMRAMCIARPSGKPGYVVRVDALDGDHCMLSIADPCERYKLDATLMSAVFGLTFAEARLAEELLGEDRLPEIAVRLGVQPSTARSHLLSIFRKTRTSSQTQLLKLLMALRSPG